jgi:DNA gyrase subunit A
MGYIKRVPVAAYRTQRRGGIGATAMQTADKDWVDKLLPANTRQSLLVFTTQGKTYWLRVYDIPEAGKQAKGVPASRLIQLEENERITAMIPVDTDSEGDLFFVTRQGVCKRTSLSEFSSVRKSGIRALNLREEDSLITVRIVNDDDEVLIASSSGKACRFRVSDVRSMGRNAAGVIGMRLAEEDYVIGADIVTPDGHVLLVSELGFGKLTPIDEFPTHRRGSTGVIALKVSDKSGNLAVMRLADPDEEVLLVTAQGIAIRTPLEHVKIAHRNTLGVKLMKVDPSDRLAASGVIEGE